MKTFWIVTELFPPEETSTSYIMGEIANFIARKYAVQIICGPTIYDIHKSVDAAHPFILDSSIIITRVEGLGIDKNSALGKSYSLMAMSRRLYKVAKSKIKSGDKVLMVTNPAPLVLLMSWLKKRKHFELSILVHDIFPENTIPAGIHLPGIAFRLIKYLFDKAFSSANQLISIGRDMAEILREKAGYKVKISIVENWADVDSIRPMPFPDGAIRLEYAGNIGRVQGLEMLVSDLPAGVELHFYGTGAMENYLRAMNRPNVYFHGPYFRSQQIDVLGECHAAVVTLSKGMYGLGVPSKAYNIMAAGRPIIYFGPEDGEIGLMVRENGIGYLGWPEKWDLDELKEMGKKARALAESKYSKTVILTKFLDAIR